MELPAWWAVVDCDFRAAIDYARAGREVTRVTSSARVQLGVQEMKAWAYLGDRHEAERAMRRAGNDLAKLPVPKYPEHHFVFDAGKYMFYAANAYQRLGEAKRAEEYAREVIASSGTRWPSRTAEAHADLAMALVQLGRADEASAVGIRALSAPRMATSTIGRMAELDEALRGSSDGQAAREFHDRFLATKESFEQVTGMTRP
jgi:tetratricopeptide (TPR) repeat protein